LDERLVILYPSKSSLNFNLNKKPDLVLIVMKFSQYNYILSLALFLTITLIREYIIQHQDMKELLQQYYRNIALGGEAFIESNTSASGNSSLLFTFNKNKSHQKRGFLKIFIVYINM